MAGKLEGCLIAIAVTDGVDGRLVMRLRYRLQEMGARVHLVGAEGDAVAATDGATFPIETIASEVTSGYYDGFVLPTGLHWTVGQGFRLLMQRVFERGRVIGALGDGLRLVGASGLVKGQRVAAVGDVAFELEKAGAKAEAGPLVRDRALVSAVDGSQVDAFCDTFADAVVVRRRVDIVDERSKESFPGSDAPGGNAGI